MSETIAKKMMDRVEKKVSDRLTYDSAWQDIAEYVHPGVEFTTKHHPGEKRNTRIYDTTALQANEQLAGSLHSLLTSPSTRWFSLMVRDPDFKVGYKERKWLDDTAERMYALFNSERSGFNSSVHEMFMGLGAFGNGCFYEEHSFQQNTIRFRSFPLADCYIAEDNDGVVNTLYRRITGSAAGMVQKLGDRTPKDIQDVAEKDPYREITIWHCVEPTGMYANQPKTDMAFVSAYIYPEKKTIISTGGYMSFPYQFPRWSKRSGESYGFGPGGASYPDIKMMQRMKEVSIRGAEKQIDPPLLVPNDSVIGPIVINPGGRINYNPTATGDSGIRPLEMNSRPQLAEMQLEKVAQQIREAFYVEWMQLPQRGPQMTATEILQRRDEYMRLLSPMLSRMQAEFTGPLIERTFLLMLQNGLLEKPPASLAGLDMKIEYLSPIAQAQRMTEMESVNRSLQMALGLSEVYPDGLLNFDLDAIIQGTSIDVNKLPAKYMRPPKAVEQIKQAKAQQQQQMQQLAAQQAQADTAKSQTQAAKNSAQAQAV